MLRFGEVPFLECSSKGDKRFSAFYARIKARGNKSIEEIFQSAKVFEDGVTNLSVKEAKGKAAINQNQINILYSKLWDEYMSENRAALLPLLLKYNGFSDIFGQKGHCCQAQEIYRIKLEYSHAILKKQMY